MAAKTDSFQPVPSPALVDGSNTTNYIVPDEDYEINRGPDFLDAISEKGSSTNSLASSVLNYQYENGRRYHAYRAGEYVAPNDEKEQERMDLNHHIYRLVIGGALFRAPIPPSPDRILDLGTGTGIWAIETADQFPRSTVIGTDLSPIQPGWVPPNCYFEVDDYESEWNFSKPFDFIHARALEGTIKDFPGFFGQVLKNLKPGGWLEIVGIQLKSFSDDDSISHAPFMTEWGDLLSEASIKFGKPVDTPRLYKGLMEDAGFENVTEDVYKVPNSPWAKDPKMKELGAFEQANLLEGMETYTLALFTRALGWTADEVRIFLSGVRKEVLNRKLHLYLKFYYVYGQKKA